MYNVSVASYPNIPTKCLIIHDDHKKFQCIRLSFLLQANQVTHDIAIELYSLRASILHASKK